jgi:protein-S-isoprenylcysteine O-methyltransferase Ste14
MLKKLGQDPQKSLSIFLKGLGFFALGVFFIFLGYYQHHYWQVLGLVFLTLGVAFSAWGYIGMFANRLINIINRRSK